MAIAVVEVGHDCFQPRVRGHAQDRQAAIQSEGCVARSQQVITIPVVITTSAFIIATV
jgi:hypothetical protein